MHAAQGWTMCSAIATQKERRQNTMIKARISSETTLPHRQQRVGSRLCPGGIQRRERHLCCGRVRQARRQRRIRGPAHCPVRPQRCLHLPGRQGRKELQLVVLHQAAAAGQHVACGRGRTPV